MGVRSRRAALGLSLCLAISGRTTGLLAGSTTGTASATVVSAVEVEESAKAEILVIRLPGLTVLAGPVTTDVSSKYVQAELEAIQRQCGKGNPCCNPPSDSRLEGDPATSLFLDAVQLGEGVKCHLTVMYN